jgi:CelD/BcsL family acetyltransferase involved in cellulose biosynthesis
LLRITVADTVQELERLRATWESLFHNSETTIFQSFGWNLLAARVFGCRGHGEHGKHKGGHAGHARPWVVWAESENGTAIVPAAVEEEVIRFLGSRLFDYQDLLAAGDPQVLREAWRKLGDLGLPLAPIRLRNAGRWRGWGFPKLLIRPMVSAPCVRAGEITAEAFTSRHGRCARLLRRLGRAGVRLRQYTGECSELVRSIYRRKGEQHLGNGGNVFADPRCVEFMVAAAAMERARCEIFTLEAGTTLVAALVCWREESVRRFYTIYYDPVWAAYSPGVALVFEITRRSLAQGLDSDYMTGEQAHKMRLATSRAMLFQAEASREAMRALAGAELPAAA